MTGNTGCGCGKQDGSRGVETCGDNFVVAITAPSGAGKTTVIKRLLELDDRLEYSVSVTTRAPRQDEAEGREYFFLRPEQFRAHLEAGELAEWAEVHGNLYGTLKSRVQEILGRGRHVVMDIDVQGAEQLSRSYPLGVYIFLLPPSMEELKRRLGGRGTEAPAALDVRLRNAVQEIGRMPKFDYLVVNDDLERSVEHVRSIITAEERRIKRLPDPHAIIRGYTSGQ